MALPWHDDGSSTSRVDRGFTGSVPRGIKEALGWSEMARSLCLYDAFTVEEWETDPARGKGSLPQ